ncbi:SpoIID/LytB domain-containing protein [Caldithrix abyssi]
MLQKGVIPDKEPTINVGIVLPEDNYTSLAVTTPEDEDYQVEFSGKNFLLGPKSELFFKLQSNGILFKINDQDYLAPNEIRIYPVFKSDSLKPGQGLTLKNVVAGRGFHWKKYINVILPDAIILRFKENNLIVINELPMEKYLMCVATSEMGPKCPIALLEAQTIAARSWLLANVEQKHRHLGMDVCNDDCCQRYQGTTFLSEQSIMATENTRGQVLLFQDQICDARYSKSCGGVMESFETIWGGDPLPYFKVKADAEEEPAEWQKPLSNEDNFRKWLNSTPKTFCSPHVVPEDSLHNYLGKVDESGHYFRWEVTIDQKTLVNNLNRHFALNASAVKSMTAIKRGGSGRIGKLGVKYLDSNGQEREFILQKEYDVRLGLHPSFLYSSAIIIEAQNANADGVPQTFKYRGAGWGHGVGLCQIGALGMSLTGHTSQEIVMHYYPGSQLKRIY